MYGFNPPAIVHPNARRLKTNDPRVVKKYLSHLRDSMHTDNLFQRMNEIYTNMQYPLSEEKIVEYEEISKLCGEKMYEAEKQCRKIRAGNIPWSPAYQKATDMVDYWRRREQYVQGRNLNARYLITLQNQLSISYDNSLSIEAIVDLKVKAMETRKRIIAAGDSKRREHRNQVAMAREAEGKGKIASIVRSMEQLELLRRLFRNIKYMDKAKQEVDAPTKLW